MGNFPGFAAQDDSVRGTAPGSIRLAIVSEAAEMDQLGDLLTVELSRQKEIVLLERQQIARILREQEVGASGPDYLRLGETMGADGLLTLSPTVENTNQFVRARLIAVGPGVVIGETRVPWIWSEPQVSLRGITGRFENLLPKLAVAPQIAIPVSVLSFHSALHSAESQALEKELTAMMIDRLAQQPELFVLERQHLGELVAEKDFKASPQGSFWTGQYVINGILDPEGFAPGQLKITATVASAKAARRFSVEAGSKRDDPAAAVETLTSEILKALNLQQRGSQWNPSAEAGRFFDEAKWAFDWGLYREAQQASESAWALGRRTPELAILRVRSYVADHWLNPWNIQRYPQPFPRDPWGEVGFDPNLTPDPGKLKTAIRALELFNEWALTFPAKPPGQNLEWSDLGLQMLDQAGGLLENFYRVAEARVGNELLLEALRARTRELVGHLSLMTPPNRGVAGCTVSGFMSDGCCTLDRLRWEDGGYWYDTPEQALQNARQAIESHFLPSDLPFLIGWTWNDRKKVPALTRQFIAELCRSTSEDLRLEGLFLNLSQTPFDEKGNLKRAEQDLIDEIWDHRQQVLRNGSRLVRRMESTLEQKYGILPLEFSEQPFSGFMARLRIDYLTNATAIDVPTLNELLVQDSVGASRRFSETEARELTPLVKAFRKRLNIPDGTEYFLLALEKSLAAALPHPTHPAQVQTAQEAIPNLANSARSVGDESRLAVSFIPWNVPDLDYGQNARVEVQSSLMRSNTLWFHVCWGNLFNWLSERSCAFVAINLSDASTELIPVPARLGPIDPNLISSSNPYFEIMEDSLFASVQTKLARYRFREKTWEEIPVPMKQGAKLTALNGILYLTTPEGLLRLKPDGKSFEILGSTRRRDPDNPLDQRGDVGLPYLAEGSLTVVAAGHTFSWSEPVHRWSEISNPAPETKRISGSANKWRVRFSPSTEPKLVHFTSGPGPDSEVSVAFSRDGQSVSPVNPFPGLMLPIYSAQPLQFDTPAGVLVIARSLAGHWLIPKTISGQSTASVPSH